MNKYIRIARPRHWIKNIVVFIPVVFSMRMLDFRAELLTILTGAAFCFASSFVYILNDLRDRDLDRLHPLKKDRPLANGEMKPKEAVIEGLFFLMGAGVLCFFLGGLVSAVVGTYILLQILYSWRLKRVPILDVIVIALGFVLRALGGVVAIRGEISPWLFICMFTLWLFMGFCKRYNEVVTIGNAEAAHTHRSTLADYSPYLLTHLITVSAGIAVLSFLLYSLSESTVERVGSAMFIYTLPIVVYAVFRFAMLSMQGRFSDPTDIILRDRVFQFTTGLWIGLSICIIFFGRDIIHWLKGWY